LLVTVLGEKTTCETTSRWSLGTLVGGIETAPFGSLTAPAGSGTLTSPDSDDNTVVDPIAFRAVTLQRILWLTSLEVRR
jgi:hypothetical protein